MKEDWLTELSRSFSTLILKCLRLSAISQIDKQISRYFLGAYLWGESTNSCFSHPSLKIPYFGMAPTVLLYLSKRIETRAIQNHSEAGRYLLSIQHILCHSSPFLIFMVGRNVVDIKFLSENNKYQSWDLWKWQQLCIYSWHVLWPQVTGLPFKKLFSKMESFSPVACCPLQYFKVKLCTTERPKGSSTISL